MKKFFSGVLASVFLGIVGYGAYSSYHWMKTSEPVVVQSRPIVVQKKRKNKKLSLQKNFGKPVGYCRIPMWMSKH